MKLKIFILVFWLLLPALAQAECALVALTGNGSDASPYRPSFPVGIEKIPDFRWSAHIPSKADGSPMYPDAYVCFPEGFKFPPGLSALPPSEVAKGVLTRDPKADLKAMTPPPAVIQGSWQDYRDRAYRLAGKYLSIAKAWAASATDNFNTGTSALSGNWSSGYTGEGTATVVSNAAECPTTTRCVASYNALVPGNDQYAQGVITQYRTTADGDAGPAVRMAAPSTFNGYFARCGNFGGTVSTNLNKRVGGISSDIGGGGEVAALAWAFGDVARLEISGTGLTVKRNGTPVLTGTDTQFTSGRGGMLLNSLNAGISADTARLDDFEVGDLGGAVATRRRVVVVQ